MTVTQYDYQCAIAGFFEIATEDAKRILPPRFTPLEVNYGRSILVVNFYHFTDSPVGPYHELVYGIMTLPKIIDGVVPKGAVFPWRVATTTAAAREHAIKKWHLPHWPEDIQVDLREDNDHIHATARAGGEVILTLEISARQWKNEPRLYQSFMQDEEGTFLAQIRYDGELSEHEEGTGVLTLTPSHPFNEHLANADIDDVAFHEVWQRGVQTFQPLQQLAP